MRRSVPLLLFLLLPALSGGQDIHFSQFYNAPLLLNPAAAGAMDGKMRGSAAYRNQWLTTGSAYQTIGGAFDMNLFRSKKKRNYLGVGFTGYSDRAGSAALKRTQFNGAVAYNLPLGEQQLIAVGLQGGYAMRSVDYAALQWGSQYDGVRFNAQAPPPYAFQPQRAYVDVAAGALWRNLISNRAEVHAGASVAHPHRPAQPLIQGGKDRLDMTIILHGEGKFAPARGDLAYMPNFFFALQGTKTEMNLGGQMRYMLKESAKYTGFVKGNSIYFGANYRLLDALILHSMLEIGDLKIGLSYDVNLSGFTVATNSVGGVEVMMIYLMGD